jgi:hypothetical protein
VSRARSITYPCLQHSIEHGVPLLTFQRLVQTIQRFMEWNFSPRVVLSSAKDISVFPQLSAQIASHSKTHNLVWTQRSGSTASADTIDTDYGDCPFIILTLGKVSRDRKYHGLNPLQTATYSLTNKKLASTLKRFSHPTDPDCVLLAICMYIVPSILCHPITNLIYPGPRWGNIRVLEPSTGILHACAAPRIMNGIRTPDVDENSDDQLGCKPSCQVPSVSYIYLSSLSQ